MDSRSNVETRNFRLLEENRKNTSRHESGQEFSGSDPLIIGNKGMGLHERGISHQRLS